LESGKRMACGESEMTDPILRMEWKPAYRPWIDPRHDAAIRFLCFHAELERIRFDFMCKFLIPQETIEETK